MLAGVEAYIGRRGRNERVVRYGRRMLWHAEWAEEDVQ